MNEYLTKHGDDTSVDHRSDRGIGKEPEIHLGPAHIRKNGAAAAAAAAAEGAGSSTTTRLTGE